MSDQDSVQVRERHSVRGKFGNRVKVSVSKNMRVGFWLRVKTGLS